ncbi:MAG: hypothetical protein HN742_02025 [Lentisphaerae bacterium]|nr:hypothetical protein [Lentisphaerota bacterium]MBT4816803.1 hypothetical protein [Lentisphaerota bacterium]MBT5611262.1 hypothetical protein [Lentisphaerota bacterium]MBT7059201.1 hypothetical protein [Lentisphaerota bacterium]MBT7840615.1 hypothetical protein [Lentisphaerota bacterium]
MFAAIIDILAFLILGIGVVVSIQAARRRKNYGFLLLALWFAVAVVSEGVVLKRQTDHIRETEQNREQVPANVIQVTVRAVSLPVMPAILLAGVWLAGRDEKEDPEQNEQMPSTS